MSSLHENNPRYFHFTRSKGDVKNIYVKWINEDKIECELVSCNDKLKCKHLFTLISDPQNISYLEKEKCKISQAVIDNITLANN